MNIPGLENRSGLTLVSGLRRQRGVTLIEILVSILVLSFGVLGVAALHTISLQGAQSAHERTQAVKIAYETLDFIRANRGAAGTIQQRATAAETSLRASNLVPCLSIAAVEDAQGRVSVTVSWLENRAIADEEDCPEAGLGEYTAGSRI